MQPHLSACRSAPHRALLGLLRPAIGLTVPEGLAEDLASSDPVALLHAAEDGKSKIYPLLATAFRTAPELQEHVPQDFLLFLDEMQRANHARNHAALEDITRVGATLQAAGIRAVFLKGAAELVSPSWPDARDRYMNDIDVLVPDAHIDAAVKALKDLGARQAEEEIDSRSGRGRHHAPALDLPGSPFVIELHWRIAVPPLPDLPRSSDVLATAEPTDLPGVFVPTLFDRMLHQVMHDQFQESRFMARQPLDPRSLVDHFVRASALGGENLAQLHHAISGVGLRLQGRALDALASRVFAPWPGMASPGWRERAWAKGKLAAFGRDERTSLDRVHDLARDVAQGLLYDPLRRRHYLGKLRQPRILSARLKDALRRN